PDPSAMLAYRDAASWTRKSILNVAHMGRFSSDQTIRGYARDIWAVPIGSSMRSERPPPSSRTERGGRRSGDHRSGVGGAALQGAAVRFSTARRARMNEAFDEILSRGGEFRAPRNFSR